MPSTILVTGAGGFIGSHLTEALVRQGHAVRALVHYNSDNRWGWLDTLPKDVMQHIEVMPGDVRDPNGMRVAMAGVRTVYHLAALIGIPYSYHAPDSYVDTNIKGTLNVLQAARDAGTERILVTSTSEVYGTARQVPITEEHPRQGQSPYSATKIGADHLALSFHLSFGLPVTVVRPFNTYGPRQSARAVIPTIITQLLAGRSSIRLGSLHPTRDLVFVEDTANAFITIAGAQDLIGEEVNIATQREISIGDLADTLMRLTGKEAGIETDAQRTRPVNSEVERLFGSAVKLHAATGWEPSFDLETGLARTVQWFMQEDNRRNYKWEIYNV
ncbi:MAG: NAD-dependent 4,6-dehydratase LegB [Flavobacteriales bacterium]|nr:NAD-dependent 4,6-dehydratase LegB [Flavobacteriales bacterium]